MKSKAVHLIGVLILVAIRIECGTGDIQHLPAVNSDASNSEFDGESTATDIPLTGCESCGPHAECNEIGGGDVSCKCLTDFINRPPNCRPECTFDSHCPDDMNCMNHHCKEACKPGLCGLNALCTTKDHITKCECKKNYTGDPYHQCILQRNLSANPCDSVECGNNTKCVKQNGIGICQCLPNHIGNPYQGCTIAKSAVKSVQKCLRHTDCLPTQTCIQSKCINPCPDFCPENADCKINDHILTCACKAGYSGDDYHYCSKIEQDDESETRSAVDREPKSFEFECTIDDECLVNTSCIQNQCLDPCSSFSCGNHTKCSVTEHRPACSCLDGYIGDPKVGCRLLPVSDSSLNASIEFIGSAIAETTLLPLFDSTSNYTEYKMTIEPPDANENVIYVKKDPKKIAYPDKPFSNLKPGRLYNISIQAKMGNRLSIPFSKLYRTMPLHPSNIALDAGSLTSYGFHVIWQSPNNATEFDEYDLVIGNLHIPRIPDDDSAEIVQQPPPTYEFFEEYRIPRSNNETNEFVVERLRPGETYEVAVKTVSGEYTSSSAIDVTVTTRPLPVKSLQFSIDVDTEYVTLQWTPNELSKQDEYKIDYYYDDESGVANQLDRTSIKTNDTSYVFQTLLPNKDYSFFVWAISKTIESNETAIYLPKRHP